MADMLKQGRQKVALQIKEELLGGRGNRQLKSVLEALLGPKAEFDADKSDHCLWLIAGGEPPDDFLKSLQQYNSSPVCGLVWNAHFVAYRCRDCAISQCMSLCAECFQNGNHEGHDFNMFRSQAGGACDCGDENVMRKQGFCSRHGSDKKLIERTPPDDMLIVAKSIIPRILLKLHDELDAVSFEGSVFKLSSSSEELLKLLSNICIADALRILASSCILSSIQSMVTKMAAGPVASFKSRLQPLSSTSSSHTLVQPVVTESHVNQFLMETETGKSGKFPVAVSLSDASKKPSDGKNAMLLDFLMDALVKYEFPNSLATFLLQLLPEKTYKISFTRSFCRRYKTIGKSLTKSLKPDLLSNHLVHVSVQLFSCNKLATTMVLEEKLLHNLISVLVDIVCQCLQTYESFTGLNSSASNVLVANCDHPILTRHCYWPVTSDLINVLSHKDVVRVFLEDDALIQQWLHLVSLLTAMNENSRKIARHIEYEPKTYITSFSVEFESVAAVMWELLRGCNKLDDGGRYCLKIVRATENALNAWMSTMPAKPRKSVASFHLSLHRYLSLFISQALVRYGLDESQVYPSNEFIARCMEYPLRTIVALNEIAAGLWVYNGIQIRGQAKSYVQCHFCNSMVDLDIFFLQIAASRLDADYFVELLLERFSIKSWFQFGEAVADTLERANSDKEKSMVEAFLNLLLTILSQRVFSGASDLEQCKKDLAVLLCVTSKTHSQLSDLIPTKPGETSEAPKNFDTALQEMADFKAPTLEADAMQQGFYIPKNKVWDADFDYTHVQLRCFSSADHQKALQRYTENMQQRGLTAHSCCWPPTKDPSPIHPSLKDIYRILQSDVLHKVLFFIIHKAVENINAVTETMLINTIHLLHLTLQYSNIEVVRGFIPSTKDTTSSLIMVANKCLDFLDNNAIDLEGLYATGERELLELDTGLYKRVCEDSDFVFDATKHRTQDIVTILQHSIFKKSRLSIFEPMLEYMDNAVVESASALFRIQSWSKDLQVLESLLSVIDEDHYQLLKRLFLHWRKCTLRDEVRVTSYAFCVRGRQRPGFALLLSYFVEKCDWLFKIHSAPPNHPSTVFDIKFSSGSIIENASIRVCPRIEQLESSYDKEPEMSNVTSEMTSTTEEEYESLISLLVKLLAKLKEISKSTPLKKYSEDINTKEIIAGDGTFHVTQLLRKFNASSSSNQTLVGRLCPSISVKSENVKMRIVSEETTDSAKADRRKRAMARQQKILAEFMSKQELFKEQIGNDEASMVAGEQADVEMTDIDEKYDCVICGQSSVSTFDRPVGVSVLLQPSTVLAQRRRECDYEVLPQIDLDTNVVNCALSTERRRCIMIQSFDKLAAGRALELGMDCGVHVQSCGHHIHIDCHQSYFKSLQDEQNRSAYDQHGFDANKGFFTCPLCRQQCNAVLPILPGCIRRKIGKQNQKVFQDSIEEITNLLTKYSGSDSLSLLTAKALEFTVLTASNETFVSSICSELKTGGHPSTAFYSDRTIKEKFLILVSCLRCCLELGYIEYIKGIKQPGSKRSCLASLSEILQFHSQCLAELPIAVWKELNDDSKLAENTCARASSVEDRSTVPLLLMDAFSILLQFVLTWPNWMKLDHFKCLVQLLFNMVVIQSLMNIGFALQEEESRMWKKIGNNFQGKRGVTLRELFGIVCAAISETKSRFGRHEEETGISQSLLSPQAIELKVQDFCLPFLRMAATLSNVLFETELPLIQDHNEFTVLALCLGLKNDSQMETSEGGCVISSYTHWLHVDACTAVTRWCKHACNALERTNNEDLSLLSINHNWPAPRLLPLPHSYDSLFQFYRKQECKNCKKVPSHPTLCLSCGTFLCFRSQCCANLNEICECVQHSIDCGCGTGVFLVISLSSILIIRSERACIWGSVYLDSFGEEDRELRRGKPLFLSKERYQHLEQQWLSHSFDRNNTGWIWHNGIL